jgi:hypothetical protein
VEAGEKKKKGDAFERKKNDDKESPKDGFWGKCSLEANLQEEANKEKVGDRVYRLFEFIGLRVPTDHDANKEGPEVSLEAGEVKPFGSNDESEQKAAKKEEFPVTGAVHDPAKKRACEE